MTLDTHTTLYSLTKEKINVKERLEHASITTTIDTYSHLYPNRQRHLADKLDNLL